MKKPCDSKLLITGICRNVAHFLPRLGVSLKRISGHFAHTELVICQGNSSDETVVELEKMIKYLGFEAKILSLDSKLAHRIERIIEARNVVVDFVSSQYTCESFDYLLNMDFDDVNLGIKGVLSCWDFCHRDWTCMAKGFKNGMLADPFAIRTDNHPDNKCAPSSKAQNKGSPSWPYPLESFVGQHKRDRLNNKLPVEVRSAFGSFSIYVFPAVYGIRYSSRKYDSSVLVSGVNYDMDCEHVSYSAEIRRRGGKIFINPRMTSSGF